MTDVHAEFIDVETAREMVESLHGETEFYSWFDAELLELAEGYCRARLEFTDKQTADVGGDRFVHGGVLLAAIDLVSGPVVFTTFPSEDANFRTTDVDVEFVDTADAPVVFEATLDEVSGIRRRVSVTAHTDPDERTVLDASTNWVVAESDLL